MKELKPVLVVPSMYVDVEQELRDLFYNVIYRELLLAITPANVLLNATTSNLIAALKMGRVFYDYRTSSFSGRFSAAIGKDLRSLGASFNKHRGTYFCRMDTLPVDVRGAILQSQVMAEEMKKKAVNVLYRAAEQLDELLKDFKLKSSKKAIKKIDEKWKKTLKDVVVAPDLDLQHYETLQQEYNESLKLPIKNFAKYEILKLRDRIEDNSKQGFRAEKMAKDIQARYEVTKNKAKFLARQETSLFMSKMTKQRYTQAGIKYYRWSTSHDVRVRGDHKHLDGKVFEFERPPVTNKETQQRNNPGEDYGCRCVARPIIGAIDPRMIGRRVQ